MHEKAFFKAVKDGDLAEVRDLLTKEPTVEQSTPLHWAAWKGHELVVEALLDAGADIQAHNENCHWGTTPLHAAAHRNQKHAAAVLIKRGANVNALKANGQGTPLGETKAHNATAAARVLREAGAIE